MIATVGGGPPFGSQAEEVESMARWELKDEQDNKNRSREHIAGCFKRRFLAKDKEVPHV